jgi:hypothetical protein
VDELKQQVQQLQQMMMGQMSGFQLAPALQLQQALLGQQLLNQVAQVQAAAPQQASVQLPTPANSTAGMTV